MTSSTHTRPVAQAPESAPPTRPEIHHLRAAGVSVVVDARGPRLPRIAHWGADLGDLDDGLLSDLVLALSAVPRAELSGPWWSLRPAGLWSP